MSADAPIIGLALEANMTQKLLKEILHYNPNTGLFTWKINANNNGATTGTTAGYINDSGYILICYKRNKHRLHRLAWLYMHGEHPQGEIDHVNHIRDDNRIENLRVVNKYEQAKNTTLRKDNPSGIVGVKYRDDRCKWEARITVNKNRINLGHYKTKIEAMMARKLAEEFYGFHNNHGKA